MVLGIHDCLIDDLFYCVVLYGAMENNLYQTNYAPPPTPTSRDYIRAVIATASFFVDELYGFRRRSAI